MDVLVMLEESPNQSPVLAHVNTAPSSLAAQRAPRDVVTLYGVPNVELLALALAAAVESHRTGAGHEHVDAIRHLYPKEKVFTFWDYFRKHWERDSGLRIDHLLLNKPAAAMLKSAGVDTWVRGLESASDHAPAWIELGAKKKR